VKLAITMALSVQPSSSRSGSAASLIERRKGGTVLGRPDADNGMAGDQGKSATSHRDEWGARPRSVVA